ncbi:MAG TPA: T9SS type A sorting domain-containing protein [Bacteroidota bacterium]|nr:T9SS type A sorting domain-containing protein [Bacteroidota bacterium]
MKHFIRLALVVLALLAMGVVASYAQSVPAIGDYGSVQSGNWSDSTTWKIWDGTGWNTAPPSQQPIGSSSSVYVLTGTTVTFDNVLSGSTNCKNLYVQSGATLASDVTLPTVTYLKINGDTVWVDGTVGSATNGFSFETRNNADFKLGIYGNTGTMNVGQIRPNSSQTTSMALTFARNVNINYAGGSGTGGSGLYFSGGRGTQSNVTITINSGVTLTFGTNSYFGMTSSATTNGDANTTINVNGALSLSAGSLTIADSAAWTSTLNVGATGSVSVGKKFTPFLSTGGGVPTISIVSGGSLTMLSGGTADFSNASAKVTGAGQFALNSGATINIGAASGLDVTSGPIQTGAYIFSTSANYSFVGTTAQATGGWLPSTVHDLTINNTAGVTLTANCTVNGTLYLTAGVFNNNSATLVAPTIVYGSGSLSTPLPVELTSFTGSANGRNVELQWNTATETNNSGFEVEKNVAGTWTKIGFVDGAGTSNTPHNYSYADVNSAATTYSYRLKQIDRDGKFIYSNAIEVTTTLSADDYKLSQNYPNPFNPSTKLTFAMKDAERTTVKVYNVLGQEVATLFNSVAQPGQVYSLIFDAKNLPSGLYFYVLHSQSRNDIKKMMLLK